MHTAGASKGLLGKLASFDFFPKAIDDVKEKETLGAIVTIIGVLVMVILFFSEVADYRATATQDTIFVDVSRQERMEMELDITFIKIQCKDIQVDIVDSTGQDDIVISRNIEQLDVDGEKEVVSPNSRNFFNSLGFMRGAKATGCRIKGTALLNRVEGNLHIAAGHAAQQSHGEHKHHTHHIKQQDLTVDFSHRINRLAFGPSFGSYSPPLDGNLVRKKPMTQINYLLKVVPTLWEDLSGNVVRSHQFSVNEDIKEAQPGAVSFPLPGVFIQWEISPFVIKYHEISRGLAHLLTRICAITGGIFVVLGLVYQGIRAAYSKIKPKAS